MQCFLLLNCLLFIVICFMDFIPKILMKTYFSTSNKIDDWCEDLVRKIFLLDDDVMILVTATTICKNVEA